MARIAKSGGKGKHACDQQQNLCFPSPSFPSFLPSSHGPGTHSAGDEEGKAPASAGWRHRLGALDDATLHAILVHLPLRDSAATVVLSRRWPRVFATLPRLVLRPATFNRRGFADEGDEDRCEDPARWMRALRCVLDRRASPVAAFEIDCGFMCVYCEWFSWVFRELCGSGGLLELSIANTDYQGCFALPDAVYTCATLTSLDLYNCRLQVPSRATAVTLRALQSLRLRNVVARDIDIRLIIWRCSVIERLEIHGIHLARNIVIRAPCLKKLDIFSYRPLCISLKKAKAQPLNMVRLSLSYGYPEHSWSFHDSDTMDTSREYSIHEIEERLDYKKMAEREHKQTDEIKNMETFLTALSCTKTLQLHLSTEYSEVLNMAKASTLMSLPKKNYLFGLESLNLTLDHNHEVLATLVSCLLNNSPNLKDLRIIELRHAGSPVPLAAEFWEKQITADRFLYHLSSVTFYTDSLLEGHPCGGICKFLVMNARVLKRMSIVYHHSQVKPEHGAKLEAAQRELHLWPRAPADVLQELTPVDRLGEVADPLLTCKSCSFCSTCSMPLMNSNLL